MAPIPGENGPPDAWLPPPQEAEARLEYIASYGRARTRTRSTLHPQCPALKCY